MEATPIYSLSYLKSRGQKLNDHLHTTGTLTLSEYVLPTMMQFWNLHSITFSTNILKVCSKPPWIVHEEIAKFIGLKCKIRPSIYYSTITVTFDDK